MRIWPGAPYPLGVTWTGEGVNVAVVSAHATRIDVVVQEGEREVALTLPSRTDGVWHGLLPDGRPGLRYRLRADGPDAPERGHRFSRGLHLLDPYARAHTGKVELEVDVDPAVPVRPRLPWCEVVDPAFDWQGDRRPRTPWSRTVIYEAHVSGLTRRHPDVPPALRGTYLGVSAPPVVDHLRALGVTAIELLPVHAFVSEPHLVRRGFENVWGYNTIGFFAPHVGYATAPGAAVAEIKTMVRELHRAGLEVILDVVYNHTAEGGPDGPVLSFRGLDNATYYHLDPADLRRNVDTTGCGNTLDVSRPRGLQLVLDSLRYWAEEVHVDGFRFDLAPALARGFVEMHRLDRFFAILQQDPALAEVKLIAEPWDLGEGGYRVGGFPAGWSEWNDQYRDTVRRVWRGDGGLMGALASRLSGSSDVFQRHGHRAPWASVNYVTAHDGFTLEDLVTYEKKHNEANGECNRDGTDQNHSRAWGVEGPTTLSVVVDARARAKRNLIATLAVSQGVPMIVMGDELGRTQRGNNNAYCQLELMTVDWALDDARRAFLEFTRRALALRREHPVLRRCAHFDGRPVLDGEEKDVTWLRQDGKEMTDGDWQGPRSALGMLIHGDAVDEVDARGARSPAETLLVVVNADPDRLAFGLPSPGPWRELLSTARADAPAAGTKVEGPTLSVPPRSLLVLARG